MTKLTGASYVKIALILLFGLLLIGAVGFGGVAGCTLRGLSFDGTAEAGDASVDAAGIRNLSIAWAAGSVTVSVVDDAETDGAIELVETAARGVTKSQQMRWDASGDTLKVDYGTWFSCFMLDKKDLEVRIPQSRAADLGTVSIDGASGRYSMQGIDCDALDIRLASGEVDADDLSAREFSVDVASGKAFVSGRFEESVHLRTASGESRITCEGACPRSVDVDVASGNVSLLLPDNEGFTARVDKASGSFETTFPMTQNGSLYVYGQGGSSIDVDLASGTFRLEKS